MKLVLFLIGRLFVIAFALLIALIAGSVFIGFGLASGISTELLTEFNATEIRNSEVSEWIFTIATIILGLVASYYVIGVAALPVTIAIAITELMRWRGLITQLVLGGLCALFSMFAILALPEGQMPANGTVIVSLAAGFVAAFFYWLIAGRNAGEWLSALGEQNTHRES